MVNECRLLSIFPARWSFKSFSFLCSSSDEIEALELFKSESTSPSDDEILDRSFERWLSIVFRVVSEMMLVNGQNRSHQLKNLPQLWFRITRIRSSITRWCFRSNSRIILRFDFIKILHLGCLTVTSIIYAGKNSQSEWKKYSLCLGRQPCFNSSSFSYNFSSIPGFKRANRNPISSARCLRTCTANLAARAVSKSIRAHVTVPSSGILDAYCFVSKGNCFPGLSTRTRVTSPYGWKTA